MSNARRKFMTLAVAMGLGSVFQFYPGSCRDYAAFQTLTALDFCSVFNCTGGSFFNFCSPIVTFVDCPQFGAGGGP